MKRYIVLIMLLMSSVANAASHGHDYNDNSGIVKRNIAIGGIRIDAEKVSRFKDGELAISSEGQNGRQMWLAPWQIVPAGRIYVGFKIVSGYYGSTYYEFYWK